MNKSHLTPHLFKKDDECSISRIVAAFPKNWFKQKINLKTAKPPIWCELRWSNSLQLANWVEEFN
jgi:hypothetical protein